MVVVIELVVIGRADTISAFTMLITNDFAVMRRMFKVGKVAMLMIVSIISIIVVRILRVIDIAMIHIVQRRDCVIARISTRACRSIGAK